MWYIWIMDAIAERRVNRAFAAFTKDMQTKTDSEKLNTEISELFFYATYTDGFLETPMTWAIKNICLVRSSRYPQRSKNIVDALKREYVNLGTLKQANELYANASKELRGEHPPLFTPLEFLLDREALCGSWTLFREAMKRVPAQEREDLMSSSVSSYIGFLVEHFG